MRARPPKHAQIAQLAASPDRDRGSIFGCGLRPPHRYHRGHGDAEDRGVLIIPLGHEKGLRRLPFVTGAIILVCVLLQLHRSLYAPSDAEMVKKVEARLVLVAVLVSELQRDGVAVDFDAIAAGDYRGVQHPRVGELKRFDRELKAFLAQDLSFRLGWSPDMGITPSLILCAFVH